MRDGRYGNAELVKRLNNDPDFCKAKENITTTDTLILDEISMVSKKSLEQLEFICRHIRGNNKVFGGMQVG